MRGTLKILLTAIVVLAAAGAFAFKYWDYITNPWTRDGQVRANVIQVTPRVSGPIVKLPIKDNQLVKAGDLLFEIDPRTYKAALNEASANLDRTRDNLKNLEQQVKGAQAAVDQSDSQIKQAESAVKSAEAQSIKAIADFERATKIEQSVCDKEQIAEEDARRLSGRRVYDTSSLRMQQFHQDMADTLGWSA